MRFTLMEFNIEYGGGLVDFQGVLDAIEAGGASVVAIEEACGDMQTIADGLGWLYFDPRTQVVSKHPLLAPEDTGGLFAYVEIQPGRVVAIVNVHLPDDRYGPFEIEGGHAGPERVVEIEKEVRLPWIEEPLRAASELAASGVPVFVTGDFNAPSHLDYTEATLGTRGHVKFPVDWPVSKRVEEAGFTDSFRVVHPDPVADPGITWPAFRPHVDGYNPGPDGAVSDRIDFIYSGGPATPLSSVVLGEERAEGVDISTSPWPSDHRAIVSTFEVSPAPVPMLLSAFPRLADEGEAVRIAYRISEGSASVRREVHVRSPGSDRLADRIELEETTPSDTVAFDTGRWEPGRYDVALVDARGTAAETTFWVQPKGGRPEISTSKPSYGVGEPVTVRWRFAPGNRADWIAVYPRAVDPDPDRHRTWQHTRAAVEGSLMFDDRVRGFPLPPGEYAVHLLEDDGSKTLAAADFTVEH